MSSYTLTLNEKKVWSRLLAKLPTDQQDIYYSPEYYELYEKNGDGTAMCFVFERDGEIALNPFLLNSVNKLGYDLNKKYYDIQGAYGYNGVVSSIYDISFRKGFHDTFRVYCIEQNIIAEFVRYNPINGNHSFSEGFTDLLENRQTVALNLEQPYDDIWSIQYTSKNRNKIRKGLKTLNMKLGKSGEDFLIFAQLYKYTMKCIGADIYYHFSDQFFSNVNNILSNHCFVFTAYDNEKNIPIGSLLLLIFQDKAHYYLSGRSEWCHNNAVNNYLLDEAIKFAKNKKCKIFHLGGGNSNDIKDPLFKFKQNFSKVFCPFYISKNIYFIEIYEQVCSSWAEKNPDKKERYNNILLKYHE